MTDLLLATSSIVLSWLAWWLLLAGLGLLLARACGCRPRSAEDFLAAFWAGFSAAIVFLVLWQFRFPVDGRAAGLVAAAGLAGLVLHARRLLARPPRPAALLTPRRLALTLFLLAAAYWVADHSLLDPRNYDSGLYHLSAIRWVETYPIVPGLGLLHGRLAFNQTYFLFVALLDAASWSGRSHHWAAGLLLLPLLARLALRLAKPLRPGEPTVGRLFEWLLLVPVLAQTNNLENIGSPSPDLPGFIISVVLALELLDLLQSPPAARRGLSWRVLRPLALGLVGITLKLSFVVFGLGYGALALAIGARRIAGRQSAAARRRLLFAAAALAVIILMPWAARDIYLSGWLGYPFPGAPFPVPWRVPTDYVSWERAMITGLARDPLKVLPWPVQGWGWLGLWSSRLPHWHPFTMLTPLWLTLFAVCLALVQRRAGVPARNSARLWLFLAVPCASLAFWFFSAPDPRFSGACFWIVAAGANAFVIDRYGPLRPRLRAALTLALMAVSFLIGGLYWPVIAPGPDHGFYPVRQADLERFTTASGLILYIPRESDRIWDAPLPGTPYPNRHLRLRVPGEMGQGFMLDE